MNYFSRQLQRISYDTQMLFLLIIVHVIAADYIYTGIMDFERLKYIARKENIKMLPRFP